MCLRGVHAERLKLAGGSSATTRREENVLAPQKKRPAIDRQEELENLPMEQEQWEGAKCPRNCGGRVKLNVKPGSRHVYFVCSNYYDNS